LDSKSAAFVKTDATTLQLEPGLTAGTPAALNSYDAKCDKNVFELENAAETAKDIGVVSKAAADNWYSGHVDHDYKLGAMAVFVATREEAYENFTRMMWKSSTKVAFGMINQAKTDTVWVVGYYCHDKPVVSGGAGPKEEVRKNVGRQCVTDGYNVCYNESALARHNERREGHAGYAPLELDPAIAKAIQTYLESPGFTGAISSQDKGKYATCGENTFVLTDQTKLSQVQLTNVASDTWYEGMQYWDITAGTPKAGATPSQIA
jgi:hypothetical protein